MQGEAAALQARFSHRGAQRGQRPGTIFQRRGGAAVSHRPHAWRPGPRAGPLGQNRGGGVLRRRGHAARAVVQPLIRRRRPGLGCGRAAAAPAHPSGNSDPPGLKIMAGLPGLVAAEMHDYEDAFSLRM
mmetsp:Transcript_44917/g.124996  ORF Transcript_44917/g.124996 Transcript_44917/m.124996 type:complete len:129 (-) Transcript_44917:252-638(-)